MINSHLKQNFAVRIIKNRTKGVVFTVSVNYYYSLYFQTHEEPQWLINTENPSSCSLGVAQCKHILKSVKQLSQERF